MVQVDRIISSEVYSNLIFTYERLNRISKMFPSWVPLVYNLLKRLRLHAVHAGKILPGIAHVILLKGDNIPVASVEPPL